MAEINSCSRRLICWIDGCSDATMFIREEATWQKQTTLLQTEHLEIAGPTVKDRLSFLLLRAKKKPNKKKHYFGSM